MTTLPYRYPKLEFFVSTIGDDTTGDGSFANPWATQQKAHDYIIANRINLVMFDDVRVRSLAGSYYNANLVIGTQGSGRNGHRIKYEAADGEPGSVRMVGGVAVTGWVVHSGSIMKANVGAGLSFNVLYENGTMARKARYPKYNPSANASWPGAQNDYLEATGVDSSHTILQYGVGHLSPGSWNLTDAKVSIWSGGGQFGAQTAWFRDTVPISSIDTGTRRITLTQSTRYPIYAGAKGSRYFVEGVLDLLTDPGEFHYDSTSGWLYYWPVDGDIDDQEIVRPTSASAITLSGSSELNPVRYVSFDGFEVACTDWTSWYRYAWVNDGDSGEGHTYPQYDRFIEMTQHRKGGILLYNSEYVNLSNTRTKGTGYSGIFCNAYNKHHEFTNILIEEAGLHGLHFEGRYPGDGDVNRDHTVQNLKVVDCGRLGAGLGLVVKNTGHSTFTNMTFKRLPRSGYFVGSYPFGGVPQNAIYAYGSVLSYIEMDQVVTDTGDVGGVSTSGMSDLLDTPWQYNTHQQITVNRVEATPTMLDYIPNGIMTDNSSYGQHFSNVRVTNSPGLDGKQIRLAPESGNHVLVNCSFFEDGTADPSFDPTLMAAPVGAAPGIIGVDDDFPF